MPRRSPDKPAYVDFSPTGRTALTWREFDHAATNLAHRLLRTSASAPGDRVAVWHKDNAAIHVLLVAIERCGAATRWARSARRRPRGGADPADRAAVAAGQRRRAARVGEQAAADADPSLRVVALGDGATRPSTPLPDRRHGRPVARRTRRRLPDQLHLGHHRAAQMRCPHAEPVALLPPEGRRQRRPHRRRRVPARDPHAVRLRNLDLAHHADLPGRDDRPNRTLRAPSRRARRSNGTAPRCCAASVRNWR